MRDQIAPDKFFVVNRAAITVYRQAGEHHRPEVAAGSEDR